jgi:hypothetical protein
MTSETDQLALFGGTPRSDPCPKNSSAGRSQPAKTRTPSWMSSGPTPSPARRSRAVRARVRRLAGRAPRGRLLQWNPGGGSRPVCLRPGRGRRADLSEQNLLGLLLQAFRLGATVVFADIEPDSLCMTRTISNAAFGPRPRRSWVVHYLAHPAQHGRDHGRRQTAQPARDRGCLAHAQGGLYKGRKLGSFGDIAAMSLMFGKSFATGEMGIVVTDSRNCTTAPWPTPNMSATTAATSRPTTCALRLHAAGRCKGPGQPDVLSNGPRPAQVLRPALCRDPPGDEPVLGLLGMCPGSKPIVSTKPQDPPWPAGTARTVSTSGRIGRLPLSCFAEALKAEGYSMSVGGNLPCTPTRSSRTTTA